MKTATPKKTQTQRLLSYLRKNRRGITTMEAMLELGICRLSERIREIERMKSNTFGQRLSGMWGRLNYKITRTRETAPNGSTVTRYKLAR